MLSFLMPIGLIQPAWNRTRFRPVWVDAGHFRAVAVGWGSRG